ncbi:MAG: YeaH/YhbH family protein [Armatimonadota bacterium]
MWGHPPFILSQDPWDLHHRAERDRQRHNEKVKEVIKQNLGEIISHQDIITAHDGKIVKIPIRGLELPRIRFDPNQGKRVGQGAGGSQPGDIIGRQPGEGQGAGKQAGTEPGVDFYEAEFTIEELMELVFEDLHLPNLQEKGSKQVLADTTQFNTIARKGPLSNIDRKRTLVEAYKRSAKEGKPGFKIHADDRRFRSWEVVPEPQRNAVIFAMRDVSGSMGEFEAYICRSFYFWMLRFLRTKYTNTEIVFITCHTIAKEVDEQEFFAAGDSGGTKLSEAYKLALDIIDKRYNPREWNIYPFLFSDGYNWGDHEVVKLVERMASISNLIGYGEIADEMWGHSDAFAPLGQALYERFASDPRVVLVRITNKEDVWPALKRFFSKHPEVEQL